MPGGLVSTVVAVHNGAEFLASALSSAMGQTYPQHEIVVIDDGSTDLTGEIAGSFSRGKITCVRQEHGGLARARNRGIAAARGAYLTFLDSDDLLYPTAVATLVTAALRGNASFVAGLATRIDRHGGVLPGSVGAQPPFEPARLLFRNPFHVGSILVAREWVQRVGGFCEELRACEDWDLWLQLARAGCAMTAIDAEVSIYRSHEGQMSRDPRLMREGSFAALARALADPCPSPSWKAARTEALLRAHLRSAARFLCLTMDAEAAQDLRAAVAVEPALLDENCERIRATLSTWESDPAIRNVADYRASVARAVAGLPGRRSPSDSDANIQRHQA
jgi:glycosyltransferase involved in cell wall biosynthesis